MDCFFHNAVPSVSTCRDCRRTICATCRDAEGTCPSCRLDARINANAGGRERLRGTVGPASPPPHQQPQPQPQSRRVSFRPQAYPRARVTVERPVAVETRTLVALGYPLWPLAALAFIGTKRNPWVRRQALQALAFNFGSAGLWFALVTLAHIPLLGLSAWPLIAMFIPVWLVASAIFGIKAWHGDDVRVPIVSEWLDERDEQKMTA